MVNKKLKRRLVALILMAGLFLALTPFMMSPAKTALQAMPVVMPPPLTLKAPDLAFNEDPIGLAFERISAKVNSLDSSSEAQDNVTDDKAADFQPVLSILMGCYVFDQADRMNNRLQQHDYRSYLATKESYLKVASNADCDPVSGGDAKTVVGVLVGPYLNKSKLESDLSEIKQIKFDVISKPEAVEYRPWDVWSAKEM